MAIVIKKVKEGYLAKVTPPHGKGSDWENADPLNCDELIDELFKLGCHQTDIGDAFYEADPEWLKQ